jgi:NADH-quinone oxidoreductase subunit M
VSKARLAAAALVALAWSLAPAHRASAADDARAPRLTISPARLSFGVPGESHTLRLANVGGAPLHLGGARVVVAGGRGSRELVVSGDAFREIPPGAVTTLTVTFHPLSGVPPPQVFAALQVIADDPGLPTDIDLRTGAPVRERVASVALRVGSSHVLSWLVFAPLLALPFLLLLPVGRERLARGLALAGAAAPLALAVYAAIRFDPTFGFADGNFGLQLEEHAVWIRAFNVEYFLAVDGISLCLIVLAALVSLIAVAASLTMPRERRTRRYLALLLLLEVGATGAFSALDSVLFFAFSEATLLPAYLLVAGWGTSARGGRAAAKLAAFAGASAALLLLAIVWLYSHSAATYLVDGTPAQHTFDMMKLAQGRDFAGQTTVFGLPFARAVWVVLFVALAIKVPIFPLHAWLADAQVEAPAPASALLAGVLTSLGLYGMLRFNWTALPAATQWASQAVAGLAVATIVWGALRALGESNLKRLCAYTSMSQMGFALLGMAALAPSGVSGALMQMFSHGLITTLLFLLVGALGDRTQTYEIGELGGLAGVMPRQAALFGLALMGSLGLPGLSGFSGQALVLLGTFAAHPLATGMAIASLVLIAGYHLWTIQRVQLGELPERWRAALAGRDLGGRELVLLLPLVVLIVVLGFYPALLLDAVKVSVYDLLQAPSAHP